MNCVRISLTSCSRLSLAESVLLAPMKRILMGGVGTNGPANLPRRALSRGALPLSCLTLLTLVRNRCLKSHKYTVFCNIWGMLSCGSRHTVASAPPALMLQYRLQAGPLKLESWTCLAPIENNDPTSMLVPTVLEFQPSPRRRVCSFSSPRKRPA